ncbi:carbohydrate ABC transporter permease [Amorphoplanes digitatis]|uniref:Multiple sugar transport system permease protein n=1 Tax=Actinoplanes digitatis TaxID=1868 RepID=A0A7W7MPG4_9ACTN|nr:sugar ABC transporter permease [Actinoplanes digitatis]MBB4762128.1 multiple sugar transport system permease protein [Actinoplanes digitatis]GID96226.1 ABC transporter permease [Actinoplanes digitatis]
MAITFAATPRTRPDVAARPRGRLGRSARRNVTGWAFAGPATLIVVGLSLFPAVWAFFISRTKWNGIAPAVDVGWRNYQRIVQDPDAIAAARHTLVLTLLFVPASILLGMLIAVALNQRIRLIGFYRTCIFVPYVASAAATGILASFVFNPQFGAANEALRRLGLPAQQFLESPGQALLVVCVIALWGEVGFTAVVYLAALQDIPPDLVEAATVDGAGRWRVFRHIILPELRPVTVFVAIWQTITAMQLFDLIYTTTRGGPMNSTQTVVYYIYELAFQTQRLGYGAAVAYLLFAVTMLLTVGVIWYSRRRGSEVF